MDKATAVERLLAKTDLSVDGCWLWTGYTTPSGYGTITIGGRSQSVHRWAYELFVGPIPSGLELDHLCRVRNCIRPDHLEAVTHRENIRRSAHPIAAIMERSTCEKGHALDGVNLRLAYRGGRTRRECRACARAKAAARRARLRGQGLTDRGTEKRRWVRTDPDYGRYALTLEFAGPLA